MRLLWSSGLFWHIAFCINNSYNVSNAEDRAVFSEYFKNRTVHRTRYFNDGFIILHFHDDIFVRNLIAWFDVHFDNFAFMQTFAQFREPVFEFG
ncbi:hypothetical protein D3C74_258300 [compost metagenome]